MMKKIVIPRRDHEVYFIPVPAALKPKLLRSFVAGQMDRLHPGFSGETALDIKRLLLDKTRWLMVTVMEAETLAEYRVLYRGAAFFTNTSIAVKKNDFSSGVQTIDDERIGCDPKNKTPLSIPLESGGGDAERPPKAVKTVPAGCGVFAGGIPAWRTAAVSACAALLVLIPLLFFPAAKVAKVANDANDANDAKAIDTPGAMQAAPKLQYLPAAIEILSGFSADLVKAGGKIARWQYSEESGPLVTLQTRGIDVLSLRRIFTQYGYVVLGDIPDVRYIDGEPHVTVCLDAAGKSYAAPHDGTFFSQSFSLPIFSDLTGELRRHGISVVSETLPSAENGNALYTLTYTAKDRGLIRSMEIITNICDKYPVRVKGMDVSIGGESSLFTVVCSLSQSDAPRYAASGGMGNTITKAFGYRDGITKEAQLLLTPSPLVAQPPQQTRAEVSIVGTIRDERGQMLFYREAGDGKIMIKDTP